LPNLSEGFDLPFLFKSSKCCKKLAKSK